MGGDPRSPARGPAARRPPRAVARRMGPCHRAAPRELQRLGLPLRTIGRRDLPRCPHCRRGGRVRGHDRHPVVQESLEPGGGPPGVDPVRRQPVRPRHCQGPSQRLDRTRALGDRPGFVGRRRLPAGQVERGRPCIGDHHASRRGGGGLNCRGCTGRSRRRSGGANAGANPHRRPRRPDDCCSAASSNAAHDGGSDRCLYGGNADDGDGEDGTAGVEPR